MKKRTSIIIIVVCLILNTLSISYLVQKVALDKDDEPKTSYVTPTPYVSAETTEKEVEDYDDISYSTVVGESMSPTLNDGDIVKIYHNAPIEYSDMVVFKEGEDLYIKRVIGLPGDKILFEDGNIYRNGVKEEFLTEDFETYQFNAPTEQVIEEGHYFVLGDNRYNSIDSRMLGNIPIEDIVGVAVKE